MEKSRREEAEKRDSWRRDMEETQRQVQRAKEEARAAREAEIEDARRQADALRD